MALFLEFADIQLGPIPVRRWITYDDRESEVIATRFSQLTSSDNTTIFDDPWTVLGLEVGPDRVRVGDEWITTETAHRLILGITEAAPYRAQGAGVRIRISETLH